MKKYILLRNVFLDSIHVESRECGFRRVSDTAFGVWFACLFCELFTLLEILYVIFGESKFARIVSADKHLMYECMNAWLVC